MKRILSLLLTLLLLLSLSGCVLSGDNTQMAVPTQNVEESTEPLFWPPLPTETEQPEETQETTLPVTPETTEPPRQPVTRPTTKPSGDIEATYIPREDEEDEGPRDEQDKKPVESQPENQQPEQGNTPPQQVEQPDNPQQPVQPNQPNQPNQPEQSVQPVQTDPPEQTDPPAQTDPPVQTQPTQPKLDPNGHYNSRDDIALYIHLYGKLPGNFYTKRQAESKFGWVDGRGDPLSKYAPGMSIGGDRFYNKEKILPPGTYYECDIDTVGAKSRGSKRIVFSKDGTVYYTSNHYKSFVKLYGPR